MAIFRYEAADTTGRILRGAMDAPSAQEVHLRLSERGYRQVNVMAGEAAAQTAQAAAPQTPLTAKGFTLSSVKPEDLGVFFRQLASLAHAGFTPSAAMADLGPRTKNRKLGDAALSIAAETARGASLAAGMARFPGLFPEYVVGLVAAGEQGGFLPFAFEEAALGAEQDAALRGNLWVIRLLNWQSLWTVLIAQPLLMALPNIFSSGDIAGGFLSLGKQFLLLWLPLGLLAHALSLGFGWLWRQPFATRFRDRFALSVPAMARLAKMRGIAAFTRVLRRLLLSGVSAEPAFVGAARAVPNSVLRDRLLAASAIVRRGGGLDEAIQAAGLLGHDPVQMLVTGQKTGQFAEMLDRVTAYYQEEAGRAIDAAKESLKRVTMLILIVVGGYVLCAATYYIYKAVFQFAGTFETP